MNKQSRIQDWITGSAPIALVAMFSGPRTGRSRRTNANYARWTGAAKLATKYDVPLVGSGHSGEKVKLRGELRTIERELGLSLPRVRMIDDRAPHTAANVANLLRVGRLMYGFPTVTAELINRPITFAIATHDWHAERVMFLASAIQIWLASVSRQWGSTLPFQFVIEPVTSEDLDPDFVQPFIEAEPLKLAADRSRITDWYGGLLTTAPTMLRRVADSTDHSHHDTLGMATELALQRYVSHV